MSRIREADINNQSKDQGNRVYPEKVLWLLTRWWGEEGNSECYFVTKARVKFLYNKEEERSELSKVKVSILLSTPVRAVVKTVIA